MKKTFKINTFRDYIIALYESLEWLTEGQELEIKESLQEEYIEFLNDDTSLHKLSFDYALKQKEEVRRLMKLHYPKVSHLLNFHSTYEQYFKIKEVK